MTGLRPLETISSKRPVSDVFGRHGSDCAPFMRWVGGKRQLLPELMKHVPATIGRYHEPFVGAGALFFHLRAAGRLGQAVLNDANERLVRTYRALRDRPEEIVAHLRSMEDQFIASGVVFYDAVRKMPPDRCAEGSDSVMAAWMIFLNRTGFNSLFRVNKKGEFNVPVGKDSKGRLRTGICQPDVLYPASAGLQGVILRHGDFALLGHPTPSAGDLWYADPPYVPLSASSNFTAYTADGFGDAEQVRLRDHARELKERGVHVILSNSSAPRVRELYQDGFTTHEVMARRNVNSKGSARGAIKELIIT